MARINRYATLTADHDAIYRLGSPFGPLWEIAAYELVKLGYKHGTVLELGGGDGRSALPLLGKLEGKYTIVDEDASMVEKAKKALEGQLHRVALHHADAYTFLESSGFFNVIYESHFVHNIAKDERKPLYDRIFENLHLGGTFVLVDMMSANGDEHFIEKQIDRYRYLPVEAADAIIAHTREDASEDYLMRIPVVCDDLARAGFPYVKVIDRIERETLIIAQK